MEFELLSTCETDSLNLTNEFYISKIMLQNTFHSYRFLNR